MSLRGKGLCKKACAVVGLFVLVAVFFFYYRYLDLKKTLVDALSQRATLAAGQRVEIGDIFLSPAAIDLSGITIKNPSGFAPGDLLRIKRVSIRPDLAELLRGSLYIRSVEVYSPEVNITRDREGRWNISEKLIRLLTEKKEPTFKYRIDEVKIRSGTFEFDGDRRLRSEHIEALLTGLSSEKGAKTVITAGAILAGNRIEVTARAYLNDEPKKIRMTLASKAFSLAAFHDLFAGYRIDIGKTTIVFSFTAEGDTESGFDIRSDVTARKASFPFFRRGAADIELLVDAFFSLKDSRLQVKNASVHAGEATSIRLRGEIDNFRKVPRYRVKVLASTMDLSHFRVVKDMIIGGVIASDGMELRGTLGQGMPEISGSAVFHDAYIRSVTVNVNRINGEVTFAPGRGFSIHAKTTAEIAKAGAFLPTQPVRFHLALSASKERDGIAFSSSATISPVEMAIGEERKIHAGRATVNVNGRMVNKKLSCKGTAEIKGLSYADRSISLLTASSSVDADKHLISVRDLKIGAAGLTANASLIQLTPDWAGGKYEITATGFNAVYPEEKTTVKGLDLSLSLGRGKTVSGDFVLSAQKLLYKGIGTGRITGKGGFDGKGFHLEIPDAEVLEGKMHLAAQGIISGNHLPLSITVGADNVDLEALSTAASSLVHSPYTLSGRLAHATFQGTIASPKDIRGQASFSGSGVSAAGKDPKRTLIKNLSVDAGLTFEGRDIAFGLNMTAGTVPARISGEVKRVTEKERTYTARVDLPEVKAAAIRDSFWDIFPDGLLYTGLDGSLSSRVEISGGGGVLRANGALTLKDFTLTGENDEYSLGPVNGVMPIGYARPSAGEQAASLPSFDRSDFEKLKGIYAGQNREPGFSSITLGTFRYGFRLLEDISLLVKQQDGVYTIGRFSANIFGGKLNGAAVITTSGGPGYRGGAMIEGLSLKKVCDNIEPVKGYITGKVDGVMTIKGSGVGLSGLIGKGDFWTYSSKAEKTKISREFLHKIAGPSLKSYVGDRSFDRGVMSFYLQKGFVVFKQLEISNRNFFGMTDLSLKVAPYNNRIAIDRLLWSITEASQRAKKE
jgi:hypothetical protein